MKVCGMDSPLFIDDCFVLRTPSMGEMVFLNCVEYMHLFLQPGEGS